MKRYSPDDGSGSTYMTESPTGEYVRWEDCTAALELAAAAEAYDTAEAIPTSLRPKIDVSARERLARALVAYRKQALEHAKGE